MERVIKFRAWDEWERRFVPIASVHFYGNGNLLVSPDNIKGHNVDQLKVMQFTGLTDKNGKEIYEGDVLQHNGPMKSEIRYVDEDAGFLLLNKHMGKMHPSKAFFSEHVEVIGNIYENPDLLKDHQ